jgi:hypothetical protein
MILIKYIEMTQIFSSTLTHVRTPEGNRLLNTTSDFGSVDSYISHDNRVTIDYLSVKEQFRRRGIGTLLLQTTIRGATEISEEPIRYVDFAITNPHTVQLLRRLFGQSVDFFAEDTDRVAKTNGIDHIQAEILTAIRQEQAAKLTESHQEFPPCFDPGTCATAKLDDETVGTWPLPRIEEASIPYWE